MEIEFTSRPPLEKYKLFASELQLAMYPRAIGAILVLVITSTIGLPLYSNVDDMLSVYYSDSENVEEVKGIFWKEILKNYTNTETILTEFSLDSSKLCVPIKYSLSCPTCQGIVDCALYNNAVEEHAFVWTRFNTSRLSGKVVFYFASMDARMPAMPGFGWSEACKLDYEYDSDNDTYTLLTDSIATIYATVDNSTCFSIDGWIDILQYTTTLVSPFFLEVESRNSIGLYVLCKAFTYITFLHSSTTFTSLKYRNVQYNSNCLTSQYTTSKIIRLYSE